MSMFFVPFPRISGVLSNEMNLLPFWISSITVVIVEVSKPWIACATLKNFPVKIDPQITSSQMNRAFYSPGIVVVWTNCMSLAGSLFCFVFSSLQNCMR